MAWGPGCRAGSVKNEQGDFTVYADSDGSVHLNLIQNGSKSGNPGITLFTLNNQKEIDQLIYALIEARCMYYTVGG